MSEKITTKRRNFIASLLALPLFGFTKKSPSDYVPPLLTPGESIVTRHIIGQNAKFLTRLNKNENAMPGHLVYLHSSGRCTTIPTKNNTGPFGVVESYPNENGYSTIIFTNVYFGST